MSNKVRSKSRKKSVKTRLITIPITLVIISIIAIVVSVGIRTNSSMKAQMQDETEFLLANVVERLADNTNFANSTDNRLDINMYQRVIEDLALNDEVMYAGFIDTNYISKANSNPDYIDKDMTDESTVLESINEEKIVASDMNYEGIDVLDIIYPVVIDGEHLGSLKIGFYLDNINAAIKSNITGVGIIGLLVIAILVFTLYKSSNEIIVVINSFRGDTEMMANGDFSMDVPQEMQARKDEFGEIARANMRMKQAVRKILRGITERSDLVASHSQELTATAHESERSADELSHVIEDIAGSSTSQAIDVENGLKSVQELDMLMKINEDNIEKLNYSTEEVAILKDEGLRHIKDLVNNTEVTRNSVRQIGNIIDNTNTSAENIVNSIHMIKSISDQTNLLALNASIEAARAGEAGRGFAVVAEEIRKLAEESSNFTGEIEAIVADLTSKTLTAVDTMESVEGVFNLQSQSVDLTDGKFQGIAESLEAIHKAITEVNSSSQSMDEQKEKLSNLIENLAAVAEENAAGTEEAAASVEEQNAVIASISNASGELAKIADELNNAVSVFKIV